MNWLKQNWFKLLIGIAIASVSIVILRYFLVTIPEMERQERYNALKLQYRVECVKSEENNIRSAEALMNSCQNQDCIDKTLEIFSDSIGESFIESCIANKLNGLF